MMKKLISVFLLSCFLFSCGQAQKTDKQIIQETMQTIFLYMPQGSNELKVW